MTCLAAGVGVGVIGSEYFGSAYGFLAVPLALALGWLFVADPTQCRPPPPARPGADTRREHGP